jgi:DNA-binding CsgD family transcriptional regulator
MRRKIHGRSQFHLKSDTGAYRVTLLTSQQRECLMRSAFGNSKKIGRELGISPRTVDTHLRLAISTLGATDRKHAFELFKVWDAPTQQKLRSPCLQQGSEKSPRQTTRIDDLQTDQTSFPPTHDDGAEVQANILRDGASENETLFGWNMDAPRPRRFLEGIEPDDLKPRHRVLIIIIGAIMTIVALASTIAVAAVYDRVFQSSPRSN